jgi:uncharacterized protein
MEQQKISWDNLHADCKHIVSEISRDDRDVDIIVGLLRGGTVPATIISHLLNKPMIAVGLRSYTGKQRGAAMEVYQSAMEDIQRLCSQRKFNALFVDDLSDTGETLNYMLETYSPLFSSVFTATPYIKLGTKHVPHYYSHAYAKGVWLDFPWETK